MTLPTAASLLKINFTKLSRFGPIGFMVTLFHARLEGLSIQVHLIFLEGQAKLAGSRRMVIVYPMKGNGMVYTNTIGVATK